jgi:hypothetical protein
MNYYNISFTEQFNINDFSFDKDNNLILATNVGIFSFSLQFNDTTTSSSNSNTFVNAVQFNAVTSLNYNLFDNYFINKVRVDNNNVIWGASSTGLLRINNGNFTVFNSTNGLQSSNVIDITIRDTYIRYLATSSGVIKMMGNSFSNINLGNNRNVNVIKWEYPNIIWCSTLSGLLQIVDNDTSEYIINKFSPSFYSSYNSTMDDNKTFFIQTLSNDYSNNLFSEVYLNNQRVGDGYNISLSCEGSLFPIVKFNCNMNNNDDINVVIRNDVNLVADLDQMSLLNSVNTLPVKINDIIIDDNQMYLSTSGGVNQISVSTINNFSSQDCITLDTIPPSGCLS